MTIEFSHIHNLVRTYQRTLRLDSEESEQQKESQLTSDRVTISNEAQECRPATPSDPDTHPPSP